MQFKNSSPSKSKENWDEEFMVEDYESDDEKKASENEKGNALPNIDMKALYDSDSDDDILADEEEPEVRKVCMCLYDTVLTTSFRFITVAGPIHNFLNLSMKSSKRNMPSESK